MAEQNKNSVAEQNAISDAERMLRIRELLVDPVVADESARVDETVERLDEKLRTQAATIWNLTDRLERLQKSHQQEIERLDLRLLAMVETLLADEAVLRSRLHASEPLKSHVAALLKGQKDRPTTSKVEPEPTA